jgi:AraC-like DNA-binding protein
MPRGTDISAKASRLPCVAVPAETLRVAVNDAPERERPALFADFFRRLGVRYDVDATGIEPVRIDLTLHRLPGLQLSSGTLQGTRYRRIRENNDPTEDVGLVFNPHGALLVAQNGRELALGAGEATLVSFTEKLHSQHCAPGKMLVLRFPRPQLAPRLADAHDAMMRRIPHGNAALKMAADYSAIARSAVNADCATQHLVVSHMYDLVALAAGASRDAAEVARGRGMHAALLSAIKRDIATNLTQADLSINRLALRHGCTPRFIQRLFEREGTSLTDYLLAERLRLARRMLTDPHRSRDKISSIALDAGFGDLSYFNRAFRRHFGDTPSGARTTGR